MPNYNKQAEITMFAMRIAYINQAKDLLIKAEKISPEGCELFETYMKLGDTIEQVLIAEAKYLASF